MGGDLPRWVVEINTVKQTAKFLGCSFWELMDRPEDQRRAAIEQVNAMLQAQRRVDELRS